MSAGGLADRYVNEMDMWIPRPGIRRRNGGDASADPSVPFSVLVESAAEHFHDHADAVRDEFVGLNGLPRPVLGIVPRKGHNTDNRLIVGRRSVVEVVPRLSLHGSTDGVTGNDVPCDLDILSSRSAIRTESDTQNPSNCFSAVKPNLECLKEAVLGEICLVNVSEGRQGGISLDRAHGVLHNHECSYQLVGMTEQFSSCLNLGSDFVAQADGFFRLWRMEVLLRRRVKTSQERA